MQKHEEEEADYNIAGQNKMLLEDLGEARCCFTNTVVNHSFIQDHWLKNHSDFAEYVDFVYWWSCTWKVGG